MINVLYAVIRGEMGGVERFLDSVLSVNSDRVRPVVLSFREGAWLDELRAATTHPVASASARREAEHFLDHQRGGERAV